ncbi:MAG TPA: hypothetical protein VL576_02870 [Candidatus Paceibacterota bacterium]|jgi:hypothetical protein|nr:hypothetical protein [Candidatus Paceibacterota bacterium]
MEEKELFDISEHEEEKTRLYKNDKDRQSFVPSEEIPDPGLRPDQFEDKEKDVDLEEDEDFDEREEEESRDEKIERLKKEIKSGWGPAEKELRDLLKQQQGEPLGYVRTEGAASIGPEFLDEGEEVVVDHISNEKPVKVSAKDRRESNDEHRGSKTAASMVEPIYHEQRKDKRKRSEGHDNIKTLPKSKKERGIRGFLRGLFHTDKKGDSDYEKDDIVGDSFDSEKNDLRDSLVGQTDYRKYQDKEDAA